MDAQEKYLREALKASEATLAEGQWKVSHFRQALYDYLAKLGRDPEQDSDLQEVDSKLLTSNDEDEQERVKGIDIILEFLPDEGLSYRDLLDLLVVHGVEEGGKKKGMGRVSIQSNEDPRRGGNIARNEDGIYKLTDRGRAARKRRFGF